MPRKPQKWALLIGINEYPKWAAKYQLQGCINDVDAIEELLISEQFGFPPQNILKLTSPADDEKLLANRANILKAFRTHLIENERIEAKDVVVVYYSGHGSYISDEDLDEEDEYDETLVPCDSGTKHAQDILDDEISILLDGLAQRTQNINLFFDSCHSGTVTRALQDAEAEDAQDQARWLPPPPPDTRAAPTRAKSRRGRRTRSMGSGGWIPLRDGYVAISACHASERANERRFLLQGFKYHGILTYYLLKALRNVGPETTYYDIWEDVRIGVNKRCRAQHPQIEGAFEREVFGGAALPRRRYVPVAKQTRDTTTLEAGLVHGATVGSRFAIYPEGVQTFEDKEARVAVVKLTQVGALTSTATVESGDIARVKVGAPAIEIEHDYGATQMAVRVIGDAPILEKARQKIKASSLLILTETDEQPSIATVRLRHLLNPDGSEDTNHGEMLCILSSGDGRALVQPVAPDDDGPKVARHKLEHIAQYHNLLAIRNTDPQSKLEGKVKLRLLKEVGRSAGSPPLEPVEPNENGDIVLKVREHWLRLEVENRSDWPLHIAAFHFGTDWSVTPIFPQQGAPDDRVLAHKSRTLPIHFRVNLQEHEKPVREDLPLPMETIKILATTQQVNLRSFWLSPTRDLEEKSSLSRLVEAAAHGSPTSATRSLEEEIDWVTGTLPIYITT